VNVQISRALRLNHPQRPVLAALTRGAALYPAPLDAKMQRPGVPREHVGSEVGA
jgi:hypothetical protein